MVVDRDAKKWYTEGGKKNNRIIVHNTISQWIAGEIHKMPLDKSKHIYIRWECIRIIMTTHQQSAGYFFAYIKPQYSEKKTHEKSFLTSAQLIHIYNTIFEHERYTCEALINSVHFYFTITIAYVSIVIAFHVWLRYTCNLEKYFSAIFSRSECTATLDTATLWHVNEQICMNCMPQNVSTVHTIICTRNFQIFSLLPHHTKQHLSNRTIISC